MHAPPSPCTPPLCHACPPRSNHACPPPGATTHTPPGSNHAPSVIRVLCEADVEFSGTLGYINNRQSIQRDTRLKSSLWGNNSRCRFLHWDSSFYYIVSHTMNKRMWHVKHVARKCFIPANELTCNNLGIWLGNFTNWELIPLLPLYVLAVLHAWSILDHAHQVLRSSFKISPKRNVYILPRCRKVMFSLMCVCLLTGGFHVTISHDALSLTVPGPSVVTPPPTLGPHHTGSPHTLLMTSGGQDWRIVQTCSSDYLPQHLPVLTSGG